MNFQFAQNTDRYDIQSNNIFAKTQFPAQTASTSEFSINLDRISSFQELYNSINKITLKPDWNFIKNDNEVVIYKIKSVSVEVPKLSVIIKVTTDLNIDVWVEEVALDVRSSLWKLLGYNFEDDEINLRYSMLLDLIRFLDVNQLLVTNRRQKWQLNPDDVNKVIKRDDKYCRICFKTLHVSRTKEIDDETIKFMNEVTQSSFLLDEYLSKLICETCEIDIEEMKRFRFYLHQAQSLLETTFKNGTNLNDVQSTEGDQLVLIRAHYEPTYDIVNQLQVIEAATPLKTEATYDEEWLLEDEQEDNNEDEPTIEVYDELPEGVKYEFNQETNTCEEVTSGNNIFQGVDPNSNRTVNLMPSSRQSRRSPIIKNSVQTPNARGYYECPECDKTYPTRPAINKHIYRVHSPATEKCPICHKVFNPYKLQCHMHFHKLQHKCDICNKR